MSIAAKANELFETVISKDGGWIVGRAIAFLGHIVAMIVVMVMTAKSLMTTELFVVYCAFISGHASLAKLIDNKYDTKRLEITTGAETAELALKESAK